MKTLSCNVLVIGGGPGGYVCAIRSGQAGLDTIIVEKSALGGTCLNAGCIPSKALIHVAEKYHVLTEAAADGGSEIGLTTGTPGIDFARAMTWKDGVVQGLTSGVGGLMRKAKVRHITGLARVIDGKTVAVETDDGPITIHCRTLVLATGSAPFELSSLPFGGPILSSTEALSLTEIPDTLAVVGGGYIGLELGGAFAKLGSRVTILEAAPRILPLYDAALTKPVMTRLTALGVRFELGAQASGYSEGFLSAVRGGDPIGLEAEKVIVAVGRRPVINGTGIETLSLDRNGPFIAIDERCQTSMSGVYAIGDITGDPMLAHRAMVQGDMVARNLAGDAVTWAKRCIPAVCYTDPEIVTAGLMPDEARAVHANATYAVFPLAANGRSLTLERKDGFVRVVYNQDNGLVLGFQAVGSGSAELAGEFALALEMCTTLTDVAETVHAHPTLGETVQEAVMLGLGSGLHL